MSTLVLVGMRRAALESAARAGHRAALVAEAAPGPRAAALAGRVDALSFGAPPEAWARLARDLRPLAPDAVVACTERAVVPAAHLRRALGLPGLAPEAAHLCTHKGAMKRAIRAAGLPCADFVEAGGGADTRREALVERLGLPLVLKPCVGSGGRGAYVARTLQAAPASLPEGWMAEAFVRGTEMSAEGFGTGGRLHAMNPTRYLVVGQASVAPGPLAAAEGEAVRALHASARRALGVKRGITHMETFLAPGFPPPEASGDARAEDGGAAPEAAPVFGEMAARPPGGHLMRLMELAYGVDPWELAFRTERGERVALPPPARAAAVWILHPGAGTVTAASGAADARSLPGVEEVALRVRPGDRVTPREGTGQEVGHVIAVGADAPEAEARLRAARAAIRLEVDADR